MKRAYNFNAGPAPLPLEVLEKAQKEFLNYQNTGMCFVEISHRGKEYKDFYDKTIVLFKELLNIPANYEILFMQGGGSLQFDMVPTNFFNKKYAGYINTGVWAKKAMQAANLFGETYEVASSEAQNNTFIPDTFNVKPETAYVHLTSNNTIFGTQFKTFPTDLGAPLIADMSSDILSKPIKVEDFALIYAGAQKNLGPSGVTIAIINKDFLATAKDNLPTMLKYKTHAENSSNYNTPATYPIYLMGLLLEWVKEQGGVKEMEKRNFEKAKIIYDVFDESDGFYIGHAEKAYRSMMNITFNLRDKDLETKFLQEGKEKGFIGIAGHRLVGGCRVSTYNAVPKEHCEILADFMKNFQLRNK